MADAATITRDQRIREVGSQEIDWRASSLALGSLKLLVFGPVVGAGSVIGSYGLTSLVAVDAVIRLGVISLLMGAVTGAVSGSARRKLIQDVFEIEPTPMVAAKTRWVIRCYRPRLQTVAIVGAMVATVVVIDPNLRIGVVFFVSYFKLGSLIGDAVLWMPMVDRWQRRTGQVIMDLRLRSGGRAVCATVPTADTDGVRRGQLGDHDHKWLSEVMGSMHRGGHFRDAAALGDRLYERWSEPSDAYNTACSLSRIGQLDLAAEYLSAALRGGFGRDHMIDDPDLQPLLPRPDVIEVFKQTRPVAPSAAAQEH